jgi:DNA-binding NarL/FixJ family response regulator
MAAQNKTQLLIVDDHEVVRLGLKAMLADSEVKVVADLASGQEAVKFVSENQVDVVLLDVRMSDGDGLNTLGRIKLDKPDLGVIMFSFSDNPTYVARAVALGACGYLLKNCTRDELIQAVKTVAAGESLWTRTDLRRVSGALATPRLTADVEVALTKRESEVLRELARGLTNEQIAATMHISYETIKEHVQHILRKIGVTDRTQAAVWAVRMKLV